MKFAVPDGVRLIEQLGAGSMFQVALVEHGGQVCLCKRLRSRMLGEQAGWQAMARETQVLQAQVLGAAQPSALPQLIAHGEDAYGPFMLQSRAQGVALSQLVEAFLARQQALPHKLLITLARRAFELLHALHTQAQLPQLIHGDLAPDHLLVSPAGEVALIDFGQARWRGMPDALEPRDERGTLPYVSPELARQERPAEQRDDVFALAASLAYALLRRPPVRSSGPAPMLLELSERGLDLAGLQQLDAPLRSLGETLRRALRFAETERLGRAGEMAALLAVL